MLKTARATSYLCVAILCTACGGGGGSSDRAATAEISAADVTVTEGDAGTTTVAVELQRTPATGTQTIDISTEAISATANNDFQPETQRITFDNGIGQITVNLAVIADTLDEDDETFAVNYSLVPPLNARLTRARSTVTIADDDPQPTVSAAGIEAAEDDGTATITVTTDAVSGRNISVDVTTIDGSATAGADFTALTAETVQIPPGALSASLTIDLIDDTTPESDETFDVRLDNPVNATLAPPGDLTVTITDNDPSVGLSNRPSNTTCVAPQRTFSSGALNLTPAFENLPGLAFPLKLVQAPGEEYLYAAERAGAVRRFVNDPAATTHEAYLTLPVSTQGEGGLLGLAFDPDWPARKHLYVSYTVVIDGNFVSRLSRLVIDSDANLPAAYTEQILLEVDQPFNNHNGGEVAFGSDRSLYWGLGDGGSANDPLDAGQNTHNWLGAMLRIDVLGVAWPTPGYTIPASNPFASNTECADGDNAQNCPEIYAWGLRNPWRWSFDAPTDTLWLADVGQNQWEEVNQITLGANYGWRCREGAHDFNTTGCTLTGLTDPIFEYDHSNGNRSITGGYVYRGTSAPALTGRYVFGDFASGRVWYLDESFDAVLIANTGLSVAAFGQDRDGEVYVLPFSSNAAIMKFESDGGVTVDNVPNNLADTGCVIPSDPGAPAAGLIPYAPNAPFWSDGADKIRWLALPDGATIDVQSDNDWDLPPGSVLMKNFTLHNERVETRLFMRHPDGAWAGYTYAWNNAQTAATRVSNGTTTVVDGQTWILPGEAECLVCHTEAAGYSLGLETAQLNGDFTYSDTGISDNQLEVFNHIDLFSTDVPEPVNQNPALADPFDPSADLTSRARAYLHTNCAGCHRPGGPAPSSLDLRHTTPLAQTAGCDTFPQSGDLGIQNARVIAPGDATRSVLLERLSRRDAFAMPPLSSLIADAQGVNLLRDWINQLDSCL